MMGIFDLHKSLYQARYELDRLVGLYGPRDPKVLEQSRRVDKLVVEIQKRMGA